MNINNKTLATLISALLITSTLALTASAETQDYMAQLTTTNDGTATYLNHTVHGPVIHLNASGVADTDPNKGTIIITLPENTTLGDIESLKWSVYTLTGYPPHADLKLDLDDDGSIDETLVFEYAYQPYTGPDYLYNGTPGTPYGHYDPSAQGSFYNPPYETWVNTFQNSTTENETGIITGASVAWQASGLPGPYKGGYFGTLDEFKAGNVTIIGDTTPSPVNASAEVLEIRIEVDNWIGASEAYVKDIDVNGETIIEPSTPNLAILEPSKTSYHVGNVPLEIEVWAVFGIDAVTYNIKDSNGTWIYSSNQTYTEPINITGLDPDLYTLHVWASNNLGIMTSATTEFTVYETQLTVQVSPETLNLRSNGNWITVKIQLPEGTHANGYNISKIRLTVNGESFSPVWGKNEGESVMLKFDRAEIQDALDEDEYTVTITGETPEGDSFEETDILKVINPGKGKIKAAQKSSRNGRGPNNQDHIPPGHQDNPGKGRNKGKGKGRGNQ